MTSVAEMTLRGAAVALTPLMHIWVRRLERAVMTELKHYVERGEPTSAKRAVKRRWVTAHAADRVITVRTPIGQQC